MTWFSALLEFTSQFDCEHRVITFHAKTVEDAIALCSEYGRQESYSFKNWHKEKVVVSYTGLLELDVLRKTKEPQEVWRDFKFFRKKRRAVKQNHKRSTRPYAAERLLQAATKQSSKTKDDVKTKRAG